jgi:hypothetical protein
MANSYKTWVKRTGKRKGYLVCGNGPEMEFGAPRARDYAQVQPDHGIDQAGPDHRAADRRRAGRSMTSSRREAVRCGLSLDWAG